MYMCTSQGDFVLKESNISLSFMLLFAWHEYTFQCGYNLNCQNLFCWTQVAGTA